MPRGSSREALDQLVRGLDLDAAANRLQGPSGSTVRVLVLRADGSRRPLELTRREVEVRSVAEAKIVILTGSVLAGVVGWLIFRLAGERGGQCAPSGLPVLPPRPWRPAE